MAAAVAAAKKPGRNPDRADAAASFQPPSIITAVNQDSPGSVSSPASAASPTNVSTPTSSVSTAPPVAIRPSTSIHPSSIKPSSTMGRMAAGPPALLSQPKSMSMTSKEWVIPPRPKPGRKPATDTPPTKRKAQNRAAQRAFRERRAARVGELEEQLDDEKGIHERTVRELQERISHLEIETETLQSRCQWLESMLEKERQARGNMAGGWDASQPQGMSAHMQGHPTSSGIATLRPLQSASSRPAPARLISVADPRPLSQPFSISHLVSPPDEITSPISYACGSCQSNGACVCAEEVVVGGTDIVMGCGSCSLGTRCECFEASFRSMASSDLKRPLPPSSPRAMSPVEKRHRSDAGIIMETDFTALFSSQSHREQTQSIFPPPTQSQLQPLPSIELRDSCGFCKDGTYCVCADSMIMSNALPPTAGQQAAEQTQTHTPPPSDNDVVPLLPIPMEVTATGAIKLPGLRSSQRARPAKPPARSGGCGPNGPGTCAQCLSDPKSGLFCRSLAANFARNNPGASSAGGCCGKGGPGGCCKTDSGPSQQPQLDTPPTAARTTATTTTPARPTHNLPPPSAFGLSLSCADAYKTISSHRHFDEAADDIGSWLPKLKTLPIPRPSGPLGGGGRGRDGPAPIEVEAASIMSVLKDFDVRFGRGE